MVIPTSIDEAIKILEAEFMPSNPDCTEKRLKEWMIAKWGNEEIVYEVLRLVVKSAAESVMKDFDKLPESIRIRLSENTYSLDQCEILTLYENFGENITHMRITQMEQFSASLSKMIMSEGIKDGASQERLSEL